MEWVLAKDRQPVQEGEYYTSHKGSGYRTATWDGERWSTLVSEWQDITDMPVYICRLLCFFCKEQRDYKEKWKVFEARQAANALRVRSIDLGVWACCCMTCYNRPENDDLREELLLWAPSKPAFETPKVCPVCGRSVTYKKEWSHGACLRCRRNCIAKGLTTPAPRGRPPL